MKKRIVSLLLALVMAFSLIPTLAFAAGENTGKVHVIVENTTYSKEDGAPWDGTLVDEWVALTGSSTMMSCVVEALGDYSQSGAESGYITAINGLEQLDGGDMSGWMGTLNDWFTNEGFSSFTEESGKLTAGDEIRIMYSVNGYGEDLGCGWSNNDTTVKALSFSAGTLSPAFDKDTHDYTLTLNRSVSSVVVTPTATNKVFQVRTSVDGTEYKRTAAVPVTNGTVITVKCGDPAWPSMNSSEEANTYTITVKLKKSNSKPGNSSTSTDASTDTSMDEGKTVKSSKTGDAGIALYAAMSLLSLTGGTVVLSRKRKAD